MIYRTRGANTTCLQLTDWYLRIELYNKQTGTLDGALPRVTSVTYDKINGAWIVTDEDHPTPWSFDCGTYDIYIYVADLPTP